jgi:hypothetical protein
MSTTDTTAEPINGLDDLYRVSAGRLADIVEVLHGYNRVVNPASVEAWRALRALGLSDSLAEDVVGRRWALIAFSEAIEREARDRGWFHPSVDSDTDEDLDRLRNLTD